MTASNLAGLGVLGSGVPDPAAPNLGVRSLYLHIPFCASRCRYCDFSTAATCRDDPLVGRYAASLCRLLGEASEVGLLDLVETLYVGGGTPTLLGAGSLGGLGLAARGACGRPLLEASFEANPESLSDEVLAATVHAGFTRVSIGVQSFNDIELRALGRIHSARVAKDRVAAAVASGLSTSIDLMCGIPYQTQASWRESLSTGAGLGIDHMSCYPLMVEEGTALERLCETGKLPWPEDDTEADDMETAEAVLRDAGLERYEVASYAHPGKACRHNISYWTGVEYLGLGSSAASMLGRASYGRLRCAAPHLPEPVASAARFRLTMTASALEVACARRLADLPFEVEQLSSREAAAEDLMLGMRMGRGVSRGLFAQAEGAIPAARLRAAVARSIELGLAEPYGPATPSVTALGGALGGLKPTERGWLMGNELYELFWDLASDD